MNKKSRILVVSAKSFIGHAIYSKLRSEGYTLVSKPESEPDWTNAGTVNDFFVLKKPEFVFLAAGKTHGIVGNIRYPAELMLDNLLIQCHVIDAAYRNKIKKCLYLASNCSYPRDCQQPMREEDILTGSLEPTNEPYAVAKIAGMKLVQAYRKQYGINFICGIPANSFGPGDDFNPEDSHVVGALMRRMHEAKLQSRAEMTVWGTGEPVREFVYIENLANACIHVMRHYNDDLPVNLGTGSVFSIKDIAFSIKKTQLLSLRIVL